MAAERSTDLKTVLCIGVSADERHDAAAVQQYVEHEKSRAKEAGFDLDFCLLDKNAANIVEQLMDSLRNRQYDGIMIGFGVRGNATCTQIFEQTINTCAQNVKPIPKFAFNSEPTNTVEAIQRAFAQS